MSVTISAERPDTEEAMALIAELEEALAPGYPSESRHGLNVEQLLKQGVAFFVTRVDGQPAGCGGVKLFGFEYGELKRMYVRPQFRGVGLAKRMVEHLAAYTLAQGVNTLRLETGIYQHAAINLYESLGFRRIEPFGDYRPDPLSLFYERQLS